ncbi:hypothetical protein ABZ934_29610 [Streptomyces sp. NPDC046557]|uniref:hypothetical protein n=1 Tax=Streptomyces sp. NPDC046557 TaxID=3155372 RepID=UPI0033E8FE59
MAASGDDSNTPYEPGGSGPYTGMTGSATGNGSVQQAGRDHTAQSTTVSTTIRNSPWTALVSLIAVVVGAVGMHALVADESGSASGQGVPALPQGTTATGPKAGGDSTGGTRVATPPPEQWRGTLALDTSGGKELDGERPTSATSLMATGDINLGMLDRLVVTAGTGGAVALWEGHGIPDQAACAASVDTTGSAYAPVTPDAVFCVRTDGGRIARLQVKTLPEDLTFAVRFDAVVWALARS